MGIWYIVSAYNKLQMDILHNVSIGTKTNKKQGNVEILKQN